MGYVGWIGTYEGSKDPAKVHQIESQVVKELLSLGAVLFCKVLGFRYRLVLTPLTTFKHWSDESPANTYGTSDGRLW